MKQMPRIETTPYLRDPERFRKALIASVASSTAIETGASVASIVHMLEANTKNRTSLKATSLLLIAQQITKGSEEPSLFFPLPPGDDCMDTEGTPTGMWAVNCAGSRQPRATRSICREPWRGGLTLLLPLARHSALRARIQFAAPGRLPVMPILRVVARYEFIQRVPLFLARHAGLRRLAEALDGVQVVLVLFSPRRDLGIVGSQEGLEGSGGAVLLPAALGDLLLQHEP